MLTQVKHKLFLWLISKRLLSLENLIFDCIAELANSQSLAEPLDSQLHLALKAVVSARACVLLLRQKLAQEAEAPQRVFLEASVYLMHFTWFSNSGALLKWRARPDKPLDGRHFRKSDVEQQLVNKLDLSVVQKFPLEELFKVFSNLSIHPTRYAMERCWDEVARRRRFRRDNAEVQELYDLVAATISITKTAVLLVQLHLFLQFLRRYLLTEPALPARYSIHEKTFTESAIESWLKSFRPLIKFAFRTADEGYRRPPSP